MLNEISTEDLKKELRRRTGIAHLEQQRAVITALEVLAADLSKVKETIASDITSLRNGGDFGGLVPEVPGLQAIIKNIRSIIH